MIIISLKFNTDLEKSLLSTCCHVCVERREMEKGRKVFFCAKTVVLEVRQITRVNSRIDEDHISFLLEDVCNRLAHSFSQVSGGRARCGCHEAECNYLTISKILQVNAVNSLNQGAVEICAVKGFVSLLEYFISLELPSLPVWKNLLKMMVADVEEEVEAAGQCLRALTSQRLVV